MVICGIFKEKKTLIVTFDNLCTGRRAREKVCWASVESRCGNTPGRQAEDCSGYQQIPFLLKSGIPHLISVVLTKLPCSYITSILAIDYWFRNGCIIQTKQMGKHFWDFKILDYDNQFVVYGWRHKM